MAAQLVHNTRDGNIDVDIDPDATVPTPSNQPKSLYSNIISLFANRFSGGKKKDEGPSSPQLSPKIVKSFTYLGTNIFGQSVEIDDRLNTFQDGIKLMSVRGPTSKVTKAMNVAAITLLHNPQRPRATALLAPYSQSLFEHPFSCRSDRTPTALPEPQRVFDDLLKSSQSIDHPNGITGLCVALAILISLSLVRIDETRPEYNQTSPFLDLSPLYGVNGTESDMIRAKDGRGMLSPDCFFDDRPAFLPPAVSALLILWNRNHNYIARHLLLNNEGKKWVDPSMYNPSDSALVSRLSAQDDEIFQMARLINCVHFKNVVAEDFLKVIAGLSNVGPSTGLDILSDIKQSEKGKGHDSTVEFSLLYTYWSSLMTKQDTEAFKERLEDEIGISLDQVTPEAMQDVLNETSSVNPNRRERHSPGLRRGGDGRFKDDELARVLQDATEQVAGAPRARSISPCFRAMEMSIINRARTWKVCSLNDFRKFLGLKTYKSFSDWNPDIAIARAAEDLYTSIDNLELYSGLQAEQTAPGSGLSLGYTMTYALLVDLVTMIRSDPRFTTELAPGKLTQWGHKDCTVAPNSGAFGAWLPKLLQRNLPRNYPYENIYGVFPLTTPKKATQLLRSDPMYDYQRPTPPIVKIISTQEAIGHVFNKPNVYPTIYGNAFKTISDGYGHFLCFDDEVLHDRDLMMTLFALIPDKGALSRYARYFGKTATELIKEKSSRNNGHISIDIVRDVINATCTHWVSRTLCGLNDSEYYHNDMTKMHEDFAALYAYIFRNVDPEAGWAIRAAAIEASNRLKKHINENLPIPSTSSAESRKGGMFADIYAYISRILEEFGRGKRLPQHEATTFLDRIVKSNRTQSFRLGELTKHGHLNNATPTNLNISEREDALERRRAVANILGLAVVTSVNCAQACAQAVDFYLDDKYIDQRREIIRLSNLTPAEARNEGANAKLAGYIREAQRLGQPLGLWRDVAEDDLILQGQGLPSITVHKGDRIFADFNQAHTGPGIVDPLKVDPNRKIASIQGMGLHKCPGMSFVDETFPELFKAIFRLKNLRRDIGKAGRLERFVCHPAPVSTDPKVYLDPTGEMSHFPRSLSLIYDDDTSSTGLASKTKKRTWEVSPGKGARIERLRKVVDYTMKTIVGLLVLTILIRLVLFIALLPARFLGRRTRPSRPVALDKDIQRETIICRTPTTIFEPWGLNAFVPGLEGDPIPIEYTHNSSKALKLSIVDIDAMDTRMAVYVDDVLRGMTRNFELNTTIDCGEDVRACLRANFSSGVVVVPPGNHTIKIEWAGKEFLPNTTEMDWGEKRIRRLKWQKEYCA